MNNDPLSLVKRVIDELNETARNNAQPFEPSPLRHGRDSRLLAEVMLGRANGDCGLAIKFLIEDLRKRYPGFKAKRGAPGFLEYDRCRSMIYSICQKRDRTK